MLITQQHTFKKEKVHSRFLIAGLKTCCLLTVNIFIRNIWLCTIIYGRKISIYKYIYRL
jgi:hypothetical protein